MKIRWLALALSVFTLQFPASESTPASGPIPVPMRSKTLIPFHTDQELAAFLRKLAEQSAVRRKQFAISETVAMAAAVSDAAPAPASMKSEADSVTNTQHAGVDEGGIVKLHGNHLVMLRRGRLFTLSVGNGDLQPISTVNAFGPDINPAGTWYDELLVSNDKVVVIGFSYARGGTEVGLFDIDTRGQLTYRSTYHFRSNDYYSSRNYASRVIGDKLILYAPLDLATRSNDPLDALPAVRKWHEGARENEFKRIAATPHVYRPNAPWRRFDSPVLHSVTICDLATRELDCRATGVVGQWGRVFYVSPTAVYVWAQGEPAMLLRLPLDGSSPNAIGAVGSPVDQFSFLETADRYLNVLVRAESSGDAMWAAEHSRGAVALMRVPLEIFGDGSQQVPPSRYRPLPLPPAGTFQNRFVGDFILYGAGNGWHDDRVTHADLYVTHTRYGGTTTLSLAHGVERIEAMGSDAVIVGADGANLHFTGIRLADRPARAQHYVLSNASQGELRSHGFFYQPDGRNSGVLGLPVRGPAAPGYEHLFGESASIVFLRNTGASFEELGQLRGRAERNLDDECQASCVDWYGNSRPLFIRGRILALLGYEVVEGRLQSDGIRELRRVNFAPSFSVRPLSRN